MTGACPSSPALLGGVPAYRQAGRDTLSKKLPFREAPPSGGSFIPEGKKPETLHRDKSAGGPPSRVSGTAGELHSLGRQL